MTISADKKGGIIYLLKAGHSLRSIANHVGVSVDTVSRYGAKQYPKNTRTNSVKTSAVKKRRALVRRMAKKVISRNGRKQPEFATARRVRDGLQQIHNVNVNRSTVTRDLLALGLRAFVRPTRPYEGSGDYDARRLRFARTFTRKYQAKTTLCRPLVESIIFSDESYVDTNDHSSRTQRASNKSEVIPRDHSNRYNIPHLMIWAAVGVGFKSKLVLIPAKRNDDGSAQAVQKRMNAADYVRMLSRTKVLDHCVQHNKIFMQDGARCHTAGSTIDYIERKGVEYINDWPASSPDLNPIENIWALLHAKISEMFGPARNRTELWHQAQAAWDAIPQSVVDAQCRSFMSRLADLRKK